MTRGGKREGAGRPTGTKKPPTKQLHVRLTPEEYDKVKEFIKQLRREKTN